MVCVAAFIVLCLVGVFVAFLSIFKRDIGRKYWAVFKKSWACVGKKVRLQKCETGFKDDVKNSLLSRVVLKHPTWVKPLGIAIEASAILIVFVTIWSLVESVKAILALWVFGTCNVSQPASCALGAEVCGIDAEEPSNIIEWTGRWFDEWGQIFVNIPEKFHNYRSEDYITEDNVTKFGDWQDDRKVALSIFDPGCLVCAQSYRNMKASDFFNENNVAMMVYPIELPDGGYKFENANVIARYIHAANLEKTDYAEKIINRILSENDQNGLSYQSAFLAKTEDEAAKMLESWLKEWGANDKTIKAIRTTSKSDAVTEIMNQIKQIVEEKLHVKGIPTLVYDGEKRSGLFKAK